jgi:hypothetical protein
MNDVQRSLDAWREAERRLADAGDPEEIGSLERELEIARREYQDASDRSREAESARTHSSDGDRFDSSVPTPPPNTVGPDGSAGRSW